jgi:RNA polymerase-binding transcription factor DksA
MKPTCIVEGCEDPVLARKLCSKDYQRAKADGILDEISPNPSASCEQCGEPIPPGRRWGARFCTVTCKDAAADAKKHAELMAARAARARSCAWCKEPLSDERRFGSRFCTEACSDAWGNHQKALSAQRAKQAARQPCEVCGGPIPASRRANAIYCTMKCKRRSQRSVSTRVRQGQQEYNRRYLYGVSPEDFDAKLAEQGGVCAACKIPGWEGKGMSPHTDHDHETRIFRGVLHGNCNNGIGMFGEDPARLRAAAAYLEKALPAASRA